MGAFRLLLGSLHCMGLYLQLSVSTARQAEHADVGNHISGHAMFTEVPHDMTARRGQDVEMACSFRGAGTPSYSLEIQWWYIRNHVDWTDRQPWTTNEVAPEEETPKDATKISVVKVVGSNISHKLRLSRVKTSDEGTYECRVIDFSDYADVRLHRVRAYLQVVPESEGTTAADAGGRSDNFEALDDTKAGVAFEDGMGASHQRQAHGHHSKRTSTQEHHGHSHGHGQQHRAGKEQQKKEADRSHGHNDCGNEPSCTP